jgi:TPP-dependent pyruvate/acetoin dehydrogenase alpha subunit
MGDGTLGEGVVYESLNIASLWGLPIIFVVENNHYAQSTPIHLALAGSIAGRFRAFGIEAAEMDTTDVLDVRKLADPVVAAVRAGRGPGALVIHTYRFSPHSKGDDSRDPAEIEERRLRDPLLVHGSRLTEEERKEARERCNETVDQAFALAYEDPFPSPSVLERPILEPLP